MTKEIELTGALHTIREAISGVIDNWPLDCYASLGEEVAYSAVEQALTLIDQILEQVPDGLDFAIEYFQAQAMTGINKSGDWGLKEEFETFRKAAKLLNTITTAKGEE